MDNISKILHYVTMVAKEPIDVDGKTLFKNKEHIKLQRSFFYVDGCNQCGACCIAESNVYTPKEYLHIMNCTEQEFIDEDLDYSVMEKFRSGIREEVHAINGKEVPFYIYDKEPNEMFIPNKNRVVPRCTWLKDYQDGRYRCTIHPVVSMTCDMPHLRFTYSNNTTVSVGTQQYGRNWALGCKVEFSEPQTEEHFNQIKESRMKKLRRIDDVSQELGVETWVPEMLEYIKKIPFENHQDFLQKDIVVFHKKFFWRTM